MEEKSEQDDWRKVTKEEYYRFARNGELCVRGYCATICEPPVFFLYDTNLPKPSNSVADQHVGKCIVNRLGPNGEKAKDDEFYEYYLKEVET